MDSKNPISSVISWLFVVALGVLLWTLVSKPKTPMKSMSYNDFTAQIQKHNLQSVKFVVGASTADVEAVVRGSGEQVQVRIARDLIPGITSELQAGGVSISFDELNRADWITFLLNAAPLFLLVAFWFFLMRQMKNRATPKPQS